MTLSQQETVLIVIGLRALMNTLGRQPEQFLSRWKSLRPDLEAPTVEQLENLSRRMLEEI